MTFGPTNAPPFYSDMGSDLKDERDKLLLIKVKALKYIDGEPIKSNDSLEISLRGRKVTHVTKTIIDEILLLCSYLMLLLLYLECICIIFRKYQFSFRLDKCEFLKDRTKYVGHEITSKGNCLAQSKFEIINDWNLPGTGQSLLSFLGLINFYHRFALYLKLKLKSLLCLCQT